MSSAQRRPLAAYTPCAGGIATGQPYAGMPWRREWLSTELGLLVAQWRAGARLGE